MELPGSGTSKNDSDGKYPDSDSFSKGQQSSDEDPDEERGRSFRSVPAANGGKRYEYEDIDVVYDSDESDGQEVANAIGNISLSLYDSHPHIGYDIDGKKIMRPATGEALDALLDSVELPKGWTGLIDTQTGRPLSLSQEDLKLLKRIQMGNVFEDDNDPYTDMTPYFTSIKEAMPLSAAPEPKRRFVPSRYEAKRVAQLVRAIKEGRILPYERVRPGGRDSEQDYAAYDVWVNQESSEPSIMKISAPKLPLPGYGVSYNPPLEYLPDAEEGRFWHTAGADDCGNQILPARFECLRKVPGYDGFVRERFERCLDLYLAPRIRKNKLGVDPNSLLPKLPRPEELKPFPTLCHIIFRGHHGRVRSVAFSYDGEWIATGGDDGTVRIWSLNGHQEWKVCLGSEEAIEVVQWRPSNDTFVLAASAGEEVFFMVPPLCSHRVDKASRDVLDAGFGYPANGAEKHTDSTRSQPEALARWSRPGSHFEQAGVLVKVAVRSPIKTMSWHRRGNFLCTVSPTGQRTAVCIHTLSKHLSQIPFRRLPGHAQMARFHPSRPLLFVATQRTVRCYDLQRQELVKVLQPGARWVSSFDVHPGGDNLIVSSYDRRLLWHDLDLSSRPYKTMRFHREAVRAVKFHQGLPLFADASDDGTVQVFHGKVVSDLMESATIVPVKVLHGHSHVNDLGVLDVDWHPHLPWCLSAGADGTCRLWV